MSGRIRTIKPELLEDEKTARLSHLEMRLFVSVLLLADDYGNLRGEPGLIRGHAFWGTEATVEEIAAAANTLIEQSLVEPYDVRGQRYLHIRGWSKHQRVDKPGKPRVPGPTDPEVASPREWKTYFIQLGMDGPIKIGKAIDVEARIAKLQTSAPGPLRKLAVVAANVEASAHKEFAKLRTHGEWFEPAPELLAYAEGIARDGIANSSRPPPVTPAPDLRSPISDPDHRSPTRTDPPPSVPVASETKIQTSPPDWFLAAIETVQQTGETLRVADSWLRYQGHRAGKGKAPSQQDAVYWLTTVMVPEARKERQNAADKRDREAKWDRQRGAPPEPIRETPEQAKKFAAELAARVAERKAREAKGAA